MESLQTDTSGEEGEEGFDALMSRFGASPPPTPDAAEAVAAEAETGDPDPRPVYAGDWKTATGAEKGAHAEAVRQWKLRNGVPVGGRMAAGSEQPVARKATPDAAPPSAPPGDAASRRVLEEIRDDHRALASDRIRAAQQLIALDRGQEAQGAGDSDLVTLRSVLELLTPTERLAWLQGERAEHAAGSAPVGGAA
jgi:hypothetical protein